MLKNHKTTATFQKQLSILGNIVNNDNLKKKDPKNKKKIDTEKLFIKKKNKK